jgi:hypothetical protein
MDSANRQLVRRALDEVKPYLEAHVEQALATVRRSRRSTRSDLQAQISLFLEHWDSVFSHSHSDAVRTYLFELKDIRNRWAHEEPFSDDEARRAADTARFVAKAVKAPNTIVESLAKLSRTIEQPDHHSATASSGRASTLRHATPPRVPVRRDAHGVITNAADLSANELAGQRVLCPACEKKIFETWPGGWDAHAAHACTGVQAATEERRKSEYRQRFGSLFRGDGIAAAPSTQRDVMRRVWAIHGPNESRAIREYAAAEERGEVARARNKRDLPPETYARYLLADGLHKGWLKPKA